MDISNTPHRFGKNHKTMAEFQQAMRACKKAIFVDSQKAIISLNAWVDICRRLSAIKEPPNASHYNGHVANAQICSNEPCNYCVKSNECAGNKPDTCGRYDCFVGRKLHMA